MNDEPTEEEIRKDFHEVFIQYISSMSPEVQQEMAKHEELMYHHYRMLNIKLTKRKYEEVKILEDKDRWTY